MKPKVKVAFASGSADLNWQLIDSMAGIYPELPLYVVSEFEPHRGEWIPFHVFRSFRENLAACRAVLGSSEIRLAGAFFVPRVPYGKMRLLAFVLSPWGLLAYNETMSYFMLRPYIGVNGVRLIAWRAGNFIRWHSRPQAPVLRWLKRVRSPSDAKIPMLARMAQAAARLAAPLRRPQTARPVTGPDLPAGISIVIPSRNGRQLLEAMLPALLREVPDEIIVIDNGSDDGSQDWLAATYPAIRVQTHASPLSFADAVNAGVALARFSHVMPLNNDMFVEEDFFPSLRHAFAQVPDLLCATAQIFFPPGVRREETGKAVMYRASDFDFPIRCDEPLYREDQTWVLYGSGGCSLYDLKKLRALGGFDSIFRPAYVEDLDLGYRGWLRGWPSVLAGGSRVEHRHRSTTSRYFTPQQLDTMVQRNYLLFIASAVVDSRVFLRLWNHAVRRLQLLQQEAPLREAALQPWRRPHGTKPAGLSEELFLALTNGDVAVFPGRPRGSRPLVAIVSPYVPYPLSHGGAVRMFNLMSRAADRFDLVLVSFCEELLTPADELLAICTEVVLVRRKGSHYKVQTDRPDTVEEFDSPSLHAAIRQTVQKWQPTVMQLEFTQMAQYAADCHPAKTILVEHDITFDLQAQLLKARPGDWETTTQLERWIRFERAAWQNVHRVVTMSDQDRITAGKRAVALPNGVDTERFFPSPELPGGPLLFIGSFAHLPNVLALEYFLDEIWPLLDGVKLHIIAGKHHERYWRRPPLAGVTLEGYVSDVRPAYRAASVVIAPLTASAGTNIKILEAMAMGKAIVSTSAGMNGLEKTGVIVADSPVDFAAAVKHLMANLSARTVLGQAARQAVLNNYDWSVTALAQAELWTTSALSD